LTRREVLGHNEDEGGEEEVSKIKALILSGILVLGGLSWLAGPTSAYAAPLPLQGQTQEIQPNHVVAVVAAAARQVAWWAAEAAVKAVAAYVAVKAAQAVLNGQGPGNDPTIVPEEVF
jgi:hypothetical protein